MAIKRQFGEVAKETVPIVLGLFTVLLGTDPFHARGRSHILSGANDLALAFWVATILLLVSPLVFPDRSAGRTKARARVTLGSGMIAGVLTAAVFGLLIFGYGTDQDRVQVGLAPTYRAAVDRLCLTRGKSLNARIATGSLESSFIVLHLRPGVSPRCDDVRIPVASILALRETH